MDHNPGSSCAKASIDASPAADGKQAEYGVSEEQIQGIETSIAGRPLLTPASTNSSSSKADITFQLKNALGRISLHDVAFRGQCACTIQNAIEAYDRPPETF